MTRIVRITWEKIQVHKSETYGIPSIGFPTESGGSAEWSVYFAVKIDGKERRGTRWEQDGVRDNHTYDIDRQLDVELDGELAIEVTARERDDSSSDDHIPGFKRNHAPEPGWDNGGTRYRKQRSNLDFDYTLEYRIEYISEGATITPGSGTLFDERYSGLWNAGSERTVVSLGQTATELKTQADQLWPQGGRLAQLQPYVLGEQVRYNAIWAFTGIRQLWNLDCDEAHFRRTTDETWSWARPQQVIPFVVGGNVRYAVLWNEGQHAQLWNPNVDEAGFRRSTGDTWGWARIHQLYGFVVGTEVRYACLWNAGQHGQVWHPNCAEAEAQKIGADNWSWARAHQIQAFAHNRERRYAVLWNAGQQGQLWNLNCDRRQVEANNDETSAWGRPRQLYATSA